MTRKRIVCVGNRFVTEDSAGPRVFDRLQGVELPRDTEVIDGGLLGLDLLPFFEKVERVVLVDAVSGVAGPSEVVVLEGRALTSAAVRRYDHAGGLAYLLRVLPQILKPVPELILVGIEPPHTGAAVGKAATLTLSLCENKERDGGGEMAVSMEAP